MSIKGNYVYDYPRPMVSVDVAVFSVRNGSLDILLIERGHEPYAHHWALPGGFIEMEETLEESAARELREETGISGTRLEQVLTLGNPGRDPRGRVISVVFLTVVDARNHRPQGGDDAARAMWRPIGALPPLAFDHGNAVEYALEWLRKHVVGDTWPFAEVSAGAIAPFIP